MSLLFQLDQTSFFSLWFNFKNNGYNSRVIDEQVQLLLKKKRKKKKSGIAFWIKLPSCTLMHWMEHDANTWSTVDMCLSIGLKPNLFLFISKSNHDWAR